MKTPLIPVQFPSIYKLANGAPGPLPSRMAQCTPDTKKAVENIARDLELKGGKLILSDMFRSYDMQLQSHKDFVTGKKTAFSPAPGGSLHEAGRAMDIDLSAIHISLADFWVIAAKHGFKPIITSPVSGVSESWHFDCAGSHRIVYNYYHEGKAGNMPAYAAMAASAILAVGIQVDKFAGKLDDAAIQFGLVRLGQNIGAVDGDIGNKTKTALQNIGIAWTDVKTVLAQIEKKLHITFKEEYPIAV